MANTFLTPFQAKGLYKGVIEALPVKRVNFLQSWFPVGESITEDRVLWDELTASKNTMGIFVEHDKDVPPVKLDDYSTKAAYFSYTKENVSSPSLDEITQRMAGDEPGVVDFWKNYTNNLVQQTVKAELRIQNLFEWVAAQIMLTGKYNAQSELHKKVSYDFGRTVTTTEASLNDENVLVSEVNLATLNANGGVGKRAWGSTGGTVANGVTGGPNPVLDVIQMAQVVIEYAGSVGACIMSNDAYAEFNKDLKTNYPDSADLTTDVILRTRLDILPRIKNFDSLTFRRSFPISSGEIIDIYTYDGYYHDRSTGVKTKYIPAGYVLMLPPPQTDTFKYYSRILHPKAQFQAMPRFVNHWENPKSGYEEWEIHSNFLMGVNRANSFVCWKVK